MVRDMSADQSELMEYLSDHLAYEREMLGFNFQQIHVVDSRQHWCAHFEAFCVHARNLYDFLRLDGGGTNFKADNYLRDYKSPRHLAVFNKLDEFVFHMSKARARADKPNLAAAQKMATWLDREWAAWARRLPEPYRSAADASPVCVLGPAVTFSGNSLLTTTNSILEASVEIASTSSD
jgi:hypothetical protein